LGELGSLVWKVAAARKVNIGWGPRDVWGPKKAVQLMRWEKKGAKVD